MIFMLDILKNLRSEFGMVFLLILASGFMFLAGVAVGLFIAGIVK